MTMLLMYRNLQHSEERYRALFRNNPIDTVIVDNDAKIVMFNLAKEKTEERLPNIGDVMYKDYAGKHTIDMFEELMECMKSGDTKEFTELKYKKRFLHVRISPFSGGAIITSIDISEKKKQENERLKMEKLESVGLLAGGIAHDFNNVLTAILGNVSMAKDQVMPGDEVFDLLNEAETASKRARTLTKQLLTFAKGGTPVKETASISDILKESSLFATRGSKSRCELSIARNLWTAEVDVGQFSQVINNLVINADQAMPEGGVIHISAQNMTIGEKGPLSLKPGRYIRISVKDEGVGISEKYLAKIFDPYFTTKYEGSGLGLATAYSIIKRHDGLITVESQPEIGTTFNIYLTASGKAVFQKEKAEVIKGRGRILVMDDDELLRKMIARILEKLGYEWEFAKDGAQAIDIYRAAKESGKTFDAAILDLTVPGGMGGKETVLKLLEIDPEAKAIVSSGYSDDPVLADFEAYGFKGKIPKPFGPQSLSEVLHGVLNDHEA